MSAVIGHGTTDRTAPPTLQQAGEAGRGGEEVAQDEGGQGVVQEGGGEDVLKEGGGEDVLQGGGGEGVLQDGGVFQPA